MTKTSFLSFHSLSSMRAAHAELAKLWSEGGISPHFLEQAITFTKQGRVTGTLLYKYQDRQAAQGLIDYWDNILSRSGQALDDPTLAEFDPTLAPELDDSLCPYVGLYAFQESNQDFFYGREQLVKELVKYLRNNRLISVSGASGSGKSSVVLAGLLPKLKAGIIDNSENWHYISPIVPGTNPLASLAWVLCPREADPNQWVDVQVQAFINDSSHLTRLIQDQTHGAVGLLVVDQFEEVFTLCLEKHIRRAFIHNLIALAQFENQRHTIIFTIRSDFESFTMRFSQFQSLYEQSQVRITPLNPNELREAIQEPAKAIGLNFEEGVVESLIQDILGEPAALPLLQFTLLQLWEKRERNRISWEAYHLLGGGRLALANSADEFFKKLIPEEQITAKRILLSMVRLGEGLEFTSNRIRRTELYKSGEARERVDRVLEKLIKARLVRLTAREKMIDEQIEIAHEALVRNWPQLVDWLEDERENLRRRLRLTTAAEQWDALDRDPGALLRGMLLEEALEFDNLSELENEYVKASQEAKIAEVDRLRRELEREKKLAILEKQRANELEEKLRGLLKQELYELDWSPKTSDKIPKASDKIPTRRRPLSSRQESILGYIQKYMENHGRSPTLREIGAATAISSTSVVNYNLTKLEKLGLIGRESDVSRGLRLTEKALAYIGVVSNVIDRVAEGALRMITIPLLGQIGAGEPIEVGLKDFTVYDEDDMVEISSDMLPVRETNDLFALRVHGDSMIDAMVNDGDLVIMRAQETAQNGDMVAVWIKSSSTTALKHIFYEGNTIRLQPANPIMEPIYVPHDDVQIQGKVMLVLRQQA